MSIGPLIVQLYDKQMEKYNLTGNDQNNKSIIDEIYNKMILTKSITDENKKLLKDYISSLTALAIGELYWDNSNKPVIEKQIKLISSGLLLKGNDKEIEKRLITRRKFIRNIHGV